MAKILRALALLSVLCSKAGGLRLSVVIHTNANEYREASYWLELFCDTCHGLGAPKWCTHESGQFVPGHVLAFGRHSGSEAH